MKKVGLFILVLCVAVFTLSASGEKDVPNAAPDKLVVWCAEVHKTVTDGSARDAVNLTKEFEELHNVTVQWVPIAWAQMLEKIQLELTVPEGEPDVVFGISDWATPSFLAKFSDLTPYLSKDPIEHMEDFPQGGLDAFSYDGNLTLVPYRSNVQLLHYNNELFTKFNLKAPTTMEELGEIAKKISYTREDGASVYGLAFIGNQTALEIIRAFGGNLLDTDGKYILDSQETREAIAFMKDLYEAGAIPPNFESLSSANNRQLYFNGLIGMMFQGDNYYFQLNDPNKSEIAGNSMFANIPPSKRMAQNPANVKLALWGVGIPKNAKESTNDLAYEFIKFLTSRSSQLEMALNGNSPSRTTVYENSDYIESAPYATASLLSSPYATPLTPAVNGIAEVIDTANAEISHAIKGEKSIDAALQSATTKILSILEREGVSQ
jgi:multiple sugar transport system substrate-binding protein